MFCLCGAAYTPSASHSTTADLAGLISSGDGAPIAATGLAIDNVTIPGSTYYDSDDANFGSAVTVTAKYLIAVMPVTANTFSASTSKLLFYVNLNTASGSATASSQAGQFTVYAPVGGWIKST
jgi:hypothetical protein